MDIGQPEVFGRCYITEEIRASRSSRRSLQKNLNRYIKDDKLRQHMTPD